MRKPKDDSCGDADGGHRGVCAAVVAGVNASSVLELPKHIFDFGTLAIENCIVRDVHLTVRLFGDAGGDASLFQGSAEPVSIVAPIG